MATQTGDLTQQLHALLPFEDSGEEATQILSQARDLPPAEASGYLQSLLGDSPEALRFITTFNEGRGADTNGSTMAASTQQPSNGYPADNKTFAPPPGPPPPTQNGSSSEKAFQPPSGPPPTQSVVGTDAKHPVDVKKPIGDGHPEHPPSYAPPAHPAPTSGGSRMSARRHTNQVVQAAEVRARDEQEMQQLLQNLQYQYRIYNADIEPEHDTDYYCSCPIHQYSMAKWRRYGVQEMWSKAVMYPGEKNYNDNKTNFGPGSSVLFSRNPYWRVVSPYGYSQMTWGMPPTPRAGWHARGLHQVIDLNNSLNREAQASVDAREPKFSIWDDDAAVLDKAMSQIALGDKKKPFADPAQKGEKTMSEKRLSVAPSTTSDRPKEKSSGLSKFRKSIGIKSSEERAVSKVEKAVDHGKGLKDQILAEENGRWPDEQWRETVTIYQAKVGMTQKIAELRAKSPIQYLHLLRAGYFEPIPVAWANQNSNPLKFSIESQAGWRGITPAWRGYEDTAEERLYWVLNHRMDPDGLHTARGRLKPDQISELQMARDRMATAVEPPPLYFDSQDTCHLQHTSEGYSRQVMPPPFRPFDRPEKPTDDTMVLLDVSGSMDFQPVRPVYEQYMITRYERGTQPKNKDVAKAIIRRFTDAMANHDHTSEGYDLITFSSSAKFIGTVNHRNLDRMWSNIKIAGGTRVMTGWQEVKKRHFEKHSESATYHPVYGWQAGPETPMLRMLLLLDGEATDMDEFELDLLGLSWAHVTIFLVGVEGCPHHHRHANELQRISDVNHHVSFVDAQGNTPERLVTHELLRRHLGYDVTYEEFTQMEELPAYTA